MEFRVLGPVELRDAGRPVDPGPPRQRGVLVALAVDAGRPVQVETLIDRVWGGATHEQMRHTLHVYIGRIRRTLEQAGTGDTAARLVRRSGGYLLDVDPDRVDVHWFRKLIEQARDRSRPDEQRAVLFRQALDLWRGTPLTDLSGDWAARVREGWQQQRLDALVGWAQAELRLGHADEVIGELTGTIVEYPLAESLVNVLMRALHGAGRSAEALDVYARTSHRLADQLGADTGTELRALHRAILRGELDQLRPATPLVTPPAATGTVPAQLPLDVYGFTGRDRELAQLDRVLDATGEQPTAVVVCVLSGTAGVGKTALAVRWAHRAAGRFPGGQLYVNLRGFDVEGATVTPAEAIRGFLDALDVPPQRIPVDLQSQIRLYRSLLAGKRVLVVLDNARDAEQVRPLLPGAPGCVVLVTSRDQLTSLVAAEGAHPLKVNLLSTAEARELLARRLGPDRVAAEPRVVDEIIVRCDRLPLALAVAAARAATAPGLPLAALAAELRDIRKRLDTLAGGDAVTDVRAVFSSSYTALGDEAARLFRLLGVQAGPDISRPAAASLAGMPPEPAARALTELVRAHLITEHTHGRFTLHDLLHTYATELVQADTAEARQAQHRLLDHYLHTAYRAALLLDPGRDRIDLDPLQPGVLPETLTELRQAQNWATAEHAVLVAAIGQSARAGFDTHTWQLAWILADYFNFQGHWHDQAATQRIALDAAGRLDDRGGQARAHRELARAYAQLGRLDDAHTHLRQSLDLFDDLGDRVGTARGYLGHAWVFELQGRYADALDQARRALDLLDGTDQRAVLAGALNAVGWYLTHVGEYQQALIYCEQALTLRHELGDPRREATVLDSVGYVHHHLGHHTEAIGCYQRALDLNRRYGDRYGEAVLLSHLGDTHLAAGDTGAARESWQHALDILDELSHPGADRLRAKLHQPVDQIA
jgi:DNA-binding SARP family transcriptional activator/tetratricopeptide (TPR) repeat protein